MLNEEMTTACNAAIAELATRRAAATQELEGTAEDSYATRNEIRGHLAQLTKAWRRVRKALLRGSTTVNLNTNFVDFSDGADEGEGQADARACGLDYVSDTDRAEEEHDAALDAISDIVAALEGSGMTVETSFVVTYPDDEDDGSD